MFDSSGISNVPNKQHLTFKPNIIYPSFNFILIFCFFCTAPLNNAQLLRITIHLLITESSVANHYSIYKIARIISNIISVKSRQNDIYLICQLN